MLQNAGAKILIFFYPTKRSYEISACNLTIRTKTAFFSLQNEYYAEILKNVYICIGLVLSGETNILLKYEALCFFLCLKT